MNTKASEGFLPIDAFWARGVGAAPQDGIRDDFDCRFCNVTWAWGDSRWEGGTLCCLSIGSRIELSGWNCLPCETGSARLRVSAIGPVWGRRISLCRPPTTPPPPRRESLLILFWNATSRAPSTPLRLKTFYPYHKTSLNTKFAIGYDISLINSIVWSNLIPVFKEVVDSFRAIHILRNF